jgi:hypothetical protein
MVVLFVLLYSIYWLLHSRSAIFDSWYISEVPSSLFHAWEDSSKRQIGVLLNYRGAKIQLHPSLHASRRNGRWLRYWSQFDPHHVTFSDAPSTKWSWNVCRARSEVLLRLK